MSAALNIYGNVTWRSGDAQSKLRAHACLRLLTESGYRLPLPELADALATMGSTLGLDIEDTLAQDRCFVLRERDSQAPTVELDTAALMAAGKDAIKELIDRAWPAAESPLTWARNKLASDGRPALAPALSWTMLKSLLEIYRCRLHSCKHLEHWRVLVWTRTAELRLPTPAAPQPPSWPSPSPVLYLHTHTASSTGELSPPLSPRLRPPQHTP